MNAWIAIRLAVTALDSQPLGRVGSETTPMAMKNSAVAHRDPSLPRPVSCKRDHDTPSALHASSEQVYCSDY